MRSVVAPAYPYQLAPRSIIHSWVEVFYEGKWVNLEGFILDARYLDGVRRLFPDAEGGFCAYGIGTPDIRNPPVEWKGTDTYIQKTGINHDYGIFDSPDAFYAEHGSNLSGFRRLLYAHVVRHLMNARVDRIRRRNLCTFALLASRRFQACSPLDSDPPFVLGSDRGWNIRDETALIRGGCFSS
jgi:hypothetical protein